MKKSKRSTKRNKRCRTWSPLDMLTFARSCFASPHLGFEAAMIICLGKDACGRNTLCTIPLRPGDTPAEIATQEFQLGDLLSSSMFPVALYGEFANNKCNLRAFPWVEANCKTQVQLDQVEATVWRVLDEFWSRPASDQFSMAEWREKIRLSTN
jgi:hypothetical protein